MAAISGKYGEISLGGSVINEFENWTLTYGDEIQTYASKAGNGAQQTLDGVAKGTGTLTLNWDPGSSLVAAGTGTKSDGSTVTIVPGALVALVCYARRNSPVSCYGSARLGPFTYGANRDGTPSKISIPFTTHGTWTLH